jgi:hypothetical protein
MDYTRPGEHYYVIRARLTARGAEALGARGGANG